jgi:hypothetical protein
MHTFTFFECGLAHVLWVFVCLFVFPPQFCDVVTGNQTGDDDPQEDLATFDYRSTLVCFGINLNYFIIC